MSAPRKFSAAERRVVRDMLTELDAMRLVVLKWRSRDGWVRGPISQNPPWYQRLCRRYKRSRRRYPKERTIIKRVNTKLALLRLLSGNTNGYVYDERLAVILEEELAARLDSEVPF